MSAPPRETPTVVGFWTGIYDAVYGSSTVPAGVPDYTGWRNSLTGADYTAAEMAEWVAATVAEIRALRPRRVLELGCGSGLLARELLPVVERYTGTDISAVAVHRLAATYTAAAHATFRVGAADDASSPDDADTVVVNSVIQHFPDAAYLYAVLRRALPVCGRDGAVFLGDVHSLPLRRALRLAVLARRTPGPVPAGRLRAQLDVQASRERELAVDPALFTRFAHEHGLAADVRLKTNPTPTEMNLFRYDVRLRPRSDRLVDPARVLRRPWEPGALRRAGAAPLVLTGVPHPGQLTHQRFLDHLDALGPDEPVHPGRITPAPGVTPDELTRAAARLGLRAFCTPSTGRPGHYDAVLTGMDHDGIACPATEPAGPLTTAPGVPVRSSGQSRGPAPARLDHDDHLTDGARR